VNNANLKAGDCVKVLCSSARGMRSPTLESCALEQEVSYALKSKSLLRRIPLALRILHSSTASALEHRSLSAGDRKKKTKWVRGEFLNVFRIKFESPICIHGNDAI
jgi:hypothetical protein